jgi:hypothetical protein
MPKGKRLKKVYRTNTDTVSLNVEQFSAELGLFPYAEKWEGEESHWWEPSAAPRRPYKKGARICK